ncbi:MAG: hypothetical protein R3D89_11440 [Sphingomonadaceae bacterium]
MQAAIALATGHRKFDFFEENKKVVRFTRDGAPALSFDKNVNQVNLWVSQRSSWSSEIGKIARDDRTVGVQKSGAQALGNNPGFHSNERSFFSADELACFHPKNLEEVWIILEEVVN